MPMVLVIEIITGMFWVKEVGLYYHFRLFILFTEAFRSVSGQVKFVS